MTDAADIAEPHRHRLSVVAIVISLASNLIPLFGVLFWGWDTFQLLMLYWMETVIVAFWTIRRLARLAPEECGAFKVNGVTQPATPSILVGFFSAHAGLFIIVHLVLLWAFFSAAWLKNIHDAASFFSELFLANGIWVALVLFFIASWYRLWPTANLLTRAGSNGKFIRGGWSNRRNRKAAARRSAQSSAPSMCVSSSCRWRSSSAHGLRRHSDRWRRC
jgi:hypothetical protein